MKKLIWLYNAEEMSLLWHRALIEAKILIVEDESVVAWHVQEALQKIGHEVIAIAKSAREAIQAALDQKPDLVLMDICLQGTADGVTAAEYLYLQMDLPVVYLTAHADEKTLQRATETSPFGYLVKPFQEADLHSTIQIALRRHQLEQALKAVQQWYATTLISIGDATIATDVDGFVAFMNPTAEVLTGWTQEEALGAFTAQVLELVREKTKDAIENPILAALCRGDTVTLPEDTLMRSWDGELRSISGSASPIRNRKGEIIGGVLVFQDVSDRRQAEEKLQQENDSLERTQGHLTAQLKERTVQLQQAIACTQLVKRVLDRSRTLSGASDQGQLLLQELGQTLGADYCWMTLHDAHHQVAMVKSEYVHRETTPFHSPVGECIDIETYAQFYLRLFQHAAWTNPAAEILPPCYQPFARQTTQLLICPISNGQQVIGEIGIVASEQSPALLHGELITQVIRQAEIALQQTRRCQQLEAEAIALKQFNALNEAFLQAFSHELRTPLTNMRMAVEMIQRIAQMLKSPNLQNADAQSSMMLWKRLDMYIEILQQEWAQECELVNDLLEFQNAETAGNAVLHPVNLQHWLPDLICRFLEQEEIPHRLSYSIPGDCAAIQVQIQILERVLLEILHGVCEVTPVADEVRVLVEQQDEQCSISVLHTLADDERLETATIVEKRRGLELRLVLARKLAIALQGKIEFDQPDGRTRLRLILPM